MGMRFHNPELKQLNDNQVHGIKINSHIIQAT